MLALLSRTFWSRTLPVALVFLLAGVAGPASSATNYIGVPLRTVLEELQRDGLSLVYNDSLVPDSLLVLRQPTATAGIPLLNEILAPLGLAAQRMGTQTWAIVSAPPGGSGEGAPGRGRSTALEEVVVTASQYNLANREPASRTFLTQSELRNLPKLADEPLTAVHRLPGAASNGLSGLAHIRGGEENETLILLDGMPLQNPFHLKSFFSPVSQLDGAIVGNLDVYGGGFPVDYGGRMGAVTDAESVDPSADGTHALGLSLFHLNALAGDTFADGRGRWLTSARRSNLPQVMQLAGSDQGEPKYFDSFLKAEYDLNDSTTLAAHALLAEDRIELNDSDKEIFARTTDRSAYLWATAEHRWSDELSGRALLGWSGANNRRTGTQDVPDEQTGDLSDKRRSHSTLVKLELEQGNDYLRWRGGVEAAWLTARYNYASTFQSIAGYPFPNSLPESIVRNEQVAPDGTQTGAFLAARWRVTDTLTGEVGLRWDNQTFDPADSPTQFSPRANLLYDVSPETQFRASWGRFYQAQGINELQVEDGVDTFFPAQRADHFILSVEHALTDSISARFEAYYKDYDQLRPRFENLFDPLVLLPELETDRVEVAATNGSVRGLEFLVRDRSAQPWGWWLSYAYARAEETVGGEDRPRSWDQRNTINGGISWSQGPWEVDVAATWHTGWPTTPVSFAPGSNTDVVIGTQNSIQFDAFRSLDVRAGYTAELGHSKLLTYVEFINLLVLKNPCCVEYTVRDAGTDSAYIQDSYRYWPRFVPNIGILWTF